MVSEYLSNILANFRLHVRETTNAVDSRNSSNGVMMNHFQVEVEPHCSISQSLNSSLSSHHIHPLRKVDDNNNLGFNNNIKITPGVSNGTYSGIENNHGYSYKQQGLDKGTPRSRSKSISYGTKMKDLSL